MFQEQNKSLWFPLYNPSPDVKPRRDTSGPKPGSSGRHRTSTAGPAPRSACTSLPKRRAAAGGSPVLQQKSPRFTSLPRRQTRLGLCLAQKTAQLKAETLRLAPPASPPQGRRIRPCVPGFPGG